MSNINAVGNRLLIQQKEVVKKTASGIVLAQAVNLETATAEVISVGDAVESTSVVVGSTVYVDWTKCHAIKGKDSLAFVKIEDVLGVVTE